MLLRQQRDSVRVESQGSSPSAQTYISGYLGDADSGSGGEDECYLLLRLNDWGRGDYSGRAWLTLMLEEGSCRCWRVKRGQKRDQNKGEWCSLRELRTLDLLERCRWLGRECWGKREFLCRKCSKFVYCSFMAINITGRADIGIIIDSMQQESQIDKVVLVIQGWWRGELARARVRRLARHMLKRKYLIRQLVETEERYIRDLSVVITDFKCRLLKQRIISGEQAGTLFANVDQIRQLNELFFATIFSQAQQYSHYKVIFDKVEKEIHFFKLYFEYFHNFPLSNALLDDLARRQDFAHFADQARTNPKYHQLTLKDYLIKPVQRLPKYVLLMKEIRKHTPPDHPDLSNICRVLATFEEVNHSNNQKLNQVVNRYKVGEIERTLLLPHSIQEPGVEFILEEPASLLTMEGEVLEGTLYLLSTELIVAREGSKDRARVLSCVPFRHGGEIMENEEHFYYKNSFTVQNGEGDSCTLVFETGQEKDLLLQKIYNQLMKAEKRNLEKLAALCHVKEEASVEFLRKMNRLDLLPEIQVLGTEERNDSMFKYTIYIIEVKIKTIKQKLFLRFSQLLDLQDLATRQGLSIKNQLLKSTWVLNHKPKKIEERKMNIQRFLKELLSKEEVVQDGRLILQALGLPPSFYSLPQQFRATEELLRKSGLSQRSTNSQEEPPHPPPIKLRRSESVCRSKRASIFHSISELVGEEPEPRGRVSRQISIQDILQANEINLGHFTRLSEALYQSSEQEKQLEFSVLIPWIESERGFVRERVMVPRSQKVYALVERLAHQISLKYFKDFRLYLEREYAGRLLDDDECLWKVFEEIRLGKYLLILKKLIYLTSEIEEREVRADRVRLQIVASQAIYDCKKDKYLLSYSSILRLSALVGLSQVFHKVAPSQLPEQMGPREGRRGLALRTRQLVVNNFTSFEESPQSWERDYEQMLKQLFQKIRGICQSNRAAFRQSGVKDEEKEFNTTNMGQLAAISILNEISGNLFHGSVSFIVQISEWLRGILRAIGEEQHLQKEELGNRNCWLVVKYHQVFLYSLSLREELFCFDYDDVLKMVAYPAAIEIHLRGKEVESLRLKTTCSYSIRELLLYYKHYNEMVAKMQQDNAFEESLIELVRDHHDTFLRGSALD